MGRGAPPSRPIARARADGARAWHDPKKLGSIANHRQERWKAPLAVFVEDLYWKRFGRERPEAVMSIEQRAAAQSQPKAERRAARATRPAAEEPADPEDRAR